MIKDPPVNSEIVEKKVDVETCEEVCRGYKNSDSDTQVICNS